MAHGFHKPALLLHELGRRLGRSRGHAVIGPPAEERDGVFGVKSAQILPTHLFLQGGGCRAGGYGPIRLWYCAGQIGLRVFTARMQTINSTWIGRRPSSSRYLRFVKPPAPGDRPNRTRPLFHGDFS